MPVHVFGNPCDIDSIEAIAKRYKLRVIYDAAHALGSTYKGQSILKYGDISCTSFHGTKLLNTAEGGACVTKNMKFYEKLKRIRFFGHDENKEIIEDGLNGKMTEIHAALGLANLKYFSEILADRKRKYLRYIELLSKNDQITFQSINEQDCNYSYFPIIFKSEKKLIETERRMNRNNIYPRRYFHPSLNTLSKIIAYDVATISEDIASRILCLPLHKELSNKQIELIASCVY
jgi:dTDP-4-amino-4,6-dideoxygalactose transaminase